MDNLCLFNSNTNSLSIMLDNKNAHCLLLILAFGSSLDEILLLDSFSSFDFYYFLFFAWIETFYFYF